MILAVVVAVNVPHKTSNLSALMFALPSLSCQLRFPNVYDGGGEGGKAVVHLANFLRTPHTHTHFQLSGYPCYGPENTERKEGRDFMSELTVAATFLFSAT